VRAGLIPSFLFPAAPDAATLHRMEPRHPERLTNPGRVNVSVRTLCGKKRPSSFFATSTLSRSTLLIALEFASKKTHSSTHLQIPILDHNTEIRSCIYGHLDSTQCLPSNESFPLGAKNSGTRLILIT
jgi:hypothetical protein